MAIQTACGDLRCIRNVDFGDIIPQATPISATSSIHDHVHATPMSVNEVAHSKSSTTYFFPLLHQTWHLEHRLPPLLQPALERPLPFVTLDLLPNTRTLHS